MPNAYSDSTAGCGAAVADLPRDYEHEHRAMLIDEQFQDSVDREGVAQEDAMMKPDYGMYPDPDSYYEQQWELPENDPDPDF